MRIQLNTLHRYRMTVAVILSIQLQEVDYE